MPTSPPSPWSAPFDGDLGDDLALALRLADAADAVSMGRFDAADLDVQLKADASHVTEADLATERAIRAILENERPGDGIFGEEFGSSGDAARQWIIDPIDGTANYLKGIPMWTTLIALAVDGVPRIGVASQPALGRRWWGATGLGAWTNTPGGEPRRLAVSRIDSIAEASASFQSISQWDDAGHLDDVVRLSRAVWRDRGYGDTWPYMLLAEGRLEFVAEFDVKEYDIAALVPIISEAGGRFTSFDGTDSIGERSAVATNGILHDDFLRLLHSPS
ncbi:MULTISPECIES: inositol monophosphatase family protein [unclassified Microbacterium]|uniref:inositol monophosphatase family protein n=1 Tax=unclassified Microbacterium TaxID=2609290 RepID=UPI00214B284D|nr:MULTISPECIES: inositol monophosphatase family protein [unclassified Microbacterium]MCR2784567.1 histidinol phosphatase [Microbacterium sp. zg.B96]MDL5350514.1 inositol monophosphatase family protein [Microbacterium sp. zg-YB36]WIM14624.1 inositol monophosphatase family protein [Microbacterium sp. zg-B96]